MNVRIPKDARRKSLRSNIICDQRPAGAANFADEKREATQRGVFPFSFRYAKFYLVLIIIKRKNMSFRDSVKQIAKDIDDYREDIRIKSRELEDIAEKIHSRAQILDAFADKVHELEEENKNLKSKS
ncbi:MAG: hypothetical protein Q8L09_00350 [Candidatus Moranbacteria bacterium]|nr:hypothetical protein [Candidatus Moranbacteria bacterium]